MTQTAPHVAIIGAGVGGLATAMRLAHLGFAVTVLERHSAPGGKMRRLATPAGPVDAGPTVLTMKPVFDALFAEVGLRLEDVVTFRRQEILARHFWRDGKTLDLMRDQDASRANVGHAFGATSAAEFSAFSNRAQTLFETFDGPMMQAAQPSMMALARMVATRPRLIAAMDPMRSLAHSLRHQFSDPRLAQLFARYATYVGGTPGASPALLGLIWHAECQGVWHVDGGMRHLAQTMAETAARRGAKFRYAAHVTRIEAQNGNVCAVHTKDQRIKVDAVVFNGDPRALNTGALGPIGKNAVPETAVTPRSLSAHVMSFAAEPQGVPLSAHNVFFAQDPMTEYAPLATGQQQSDPTIYVCAQDRFDGATPTGPERFEVILNSPPADPSEHPEKVKQQCQTLILAQLREHGLTFSPTPQTATLTGPTDFDGLFPQTAGSLYGRSPHGMMAAFKRPTARTAVKGLYLAGGGAHPGAGVPMAALSARHAVAAILKDLPLT